MQTGAQRFFDSYDTDGKPTPIRFITPILDRIEFTPVVFTTKEANHITCEEVNAFYNTLYPGPTFGPRHFLRLYDKLILAHEGNFPIPGWHTYLVANYFLERCNLAFDKEDGHTEWKNVVLMPKKGVANFQAIETNVLKALNEDQMEEVKKPRKRGKQSEKEYNMTNTPKITVTEPPIDWAAIAQKERDDREQARLHSMRPRFPCCGEYADEPIFFHKQTCKVWQKTIQVSQEKMEIE